LKGSLSVSDDEKAESFLLLKIKRISHDLNASGVIYQKKE